MRGGFSEVYLANLLSEFVEACRGIYQVLEASWHRVQRFDFAAVDFGNVALSGGFVQYFATWVDLNHFVKCFADSLLRREQELRHGRGLERPAERMARLHRQVEIGILVCLRTTL